MRPDDTALRLLIAELLSPVGDSEAELLSDIAEVVQVLQGISADAPMALKMKINDAVKALNGATVGSPRAVASALSKILTFISDQGIDAPGLVLRLETLLRRSLPVAGDYDPPQSSLKAPFEPSKAGRFAVVSERRRTTG